MNLRIIRVKSRRELDHLPQRDINRAHVIICSRVVTKARFGCGYALGDAA